MNQNTKKKFNRAAYLIASNYQPNINEDDYNDDISNAGDYELLKGNYNKVDCNCKKKGTIKDIIINEAAAAETEAELFCKVVNRLINEIENAKSFCTIEYIIKFANEYFISSAMKETAISNVINSCIEIEKSD